MAVATALAGTDGSLANRYAAVRQELTGFGRIGGSASAVIGLPSIGRLQELIAARPPAGLIARGRGLSYGDAALNRDGIVVAPVTAAAVDLDPDRQTVTATASTTFAEVLRRIVPAGFILPVLPGTGHLTVGGAIAADVHGKNHRQAGSLSAWVERVELLDGTGEVRQLSVLSDPLGLRATVGGMGLTGVVLSATIRLRRIETGMIHVVSRRAADLDSALSMLEATTAQYSVAWIDAAAPGRSLGRGVVEQADHALTADDFGAGHRLSYRQRQPRRVPAAPVPLVTPLTARALGSLRFAAAARERSRLADLATFFHPLDAVPGWNRALACRGLVHYQFVVPLGAEAVLAEVLRSVQRQRCAPVFGTLSRFGIASGGPLSFPLTGWCLAVGVPVGQAQLSALLTGLDMRVAEAGGRIYLADDTRLGQYAFESMYRELPGWQTVRARLDPRGVFQSDLGRRLGLC
ncbi:MAG TPA: FAD-binding oxidoreductase [Streptosporangiaceae bacterium]|nr:FAD-binding oxidoreductase [Streptosporangiaceae bacterium]